MPGTEPKRQGERRRRHHRTAHGRGKKFATTSDHVRIFGRHAVQAALGNGLRTIHRIYVTDATQDTVDIAQLSMQRADDLELRRAGAVFGVRHAPAVLPDAPTPLPEPELVTARDLDRTLGTDTVHQGCLIECSPLFETDLTGLFDAALVADRGDDPKPMVVVLDHVTDPHNVGAILRSAAAFNVGALIMTRRYSPALGGALAKAAVGALEHVPVYLVVNLADTLDELRANGFCALGLEASMPDAIERQIIRQPIALVLGAEEKGLRPKTREHCDMLVSLTTAGGWTSLNVSNAAAIAMHTLRNS